MKNLAAPSGARPRPPLHACSSSASPAAAECSTTGSTSGSSKRLRLLAIVVCIAVASALGGWLLGRRVKSPAEAAAERKPPPASLITVPVEEKVLSADVIIRGTIRFAEPKKIGLAGPLAGAAASSPVVTEAPERGADLVDGAVVVEASGRPVFAFIGAHPMYRSINPGASGADVKQLEAALVRMGFDPGPVDGVFDEASEAAVDKWYESKGFTSQGPSDEQHTQLRTLRNSVLSAADSLRAAQRSLAEGSAGLSEAEKLELDIAFRTAGSAVEAARSEQKRNDTESNAEVATKQAALDVAVVARDTATDAGSVNTSTSLAHTAAEIAALEAAVTAAQGQLDSARAAAEATTNAGLQAVHGANDQLELARLRRAEAEKPKDSTQLQQGVKDAQKAKTLADEELARLESEVGTSVPAGELIFFPVLPLRIEDIEVRAGDALSGQFLTVSGSSIQIDASVSAADVDLLAGGAEVEIEATDFDETFVGTITELATKPGTKGASESRFYVGVTPSGTTEVQQFAGSSARITVPVESTGGAKVLAVPLAALSTTADGMNRIEVADESGTTRDVTVRVGLSAQGFVQITPLAGGELSAGDRVVVGIT